MLILQTQVRLSSLSVLRLIAKRTGHDSKDYPHAGHAIHLHNYADTPMNDTLLFWSLMDFKRPLGGDDV